MPGALPEVALIAALVLVGVSQLLFKRWAIAHRHRPEKRRHVLDDLTPLGPLALTMAGFAVAQLGFFVALTELPVGVVYMSTAATQVLVLFMSHHWLGEQVTRHHVVGVTAIATGILLYSM